MGWITKDIYPFERVKVNRVPSKCSCASYSLRYLVLDLRTLVTVEIDAEEKMIVGIMLLNEGRRKGGRRISKRKGRGKVVFSSSHARGDESGSCRSRIWGLQNAR